MKRYLKFTLYLWMGVAILCACVTTWFFIDKDTESGTFMMVVTLFAGIMYSLRRRFNRHVERKIKQMEELEGKK
jgi:hypothetical protein